MQEHEREILEQYDMTIISTRKIRGAILCNTDQGLYLLKETSAPEQRLQALIKLYDHLERQNWCAVDSIMKNKESQYVTSSENNVQYIVKKWYPGKECDVRKPGEILEAAGTLAKLHIFLQREIEGLKISQEETPVELYERHNKELKKVRRFIRKISPKDEFEYAFLKSFENMYQWAEAAGNLLQGFDYPKFYQKSLREKCIVHGEYNYHNILMRVEENQSQQIAVTNFDKFGYGVQIEDLYYFMRKTLEKYSWKERIGDSMLNAYSAVRPLGDEDIEYLKIRFVYPEKFWKVANTYYYSNKAWTSVKNVEKLNIAIRQTKEKERFLTNVLGYKMDE